MTRRWFSPSTERLVAKRAGLEQQLEVLKAAEPTTAQQYVLRRCRENLDQVTTLDDPWRPHHPQLVWRLLHRVDEDLLLVMPRPEALAAGQDLLAAFEMNVTEPKLRLAWLGEDGKNGPLPKAIEQLRGKAEFTSSGKEDEEDEKARHLLRQGLRLVNEQMDNGFWNLSSTTFTALASGIALGIAMLAFWQLHCASSLRLDPGAPEFALDDRQLGSLALLGLMGGYLSNALTREGFLYPPGVSYLRYLLLYLVGRPVVSAFGAVLLALLVKIGFFLVINPTDRTGIVALHVNPRDVGYAYGMLAVVAGFAADKLLRDMIGRVMTLLEQKAEKTKESLPVPAKAGEPRTVHV